MARAAPGIHEHDRGNRGRREPAAGARLPERGEPQAGEDGHRQKEEIAESGRGA